MYLLSVYITNRMQNRCNKNVYLKIGVIKANPIEYVRTFGNTLRHASEMPQYVIDIQAPDGMVLAAEYEFNPIYQLEGNVEALNLVDLVKEGLEMYRPQLEKLNAREHRQPSHGSVTLEVVHR